MLALLRRRKQTTHLIMKQILVPTDFSDAAQTAVKVASGIAEKQNAGLILLHILEFPGGAVFTGDGQVLTLENWRQNISSAAEIEGAKQKLERLSKELKGKGLSVKSHLTLGSPFQSIDTLITEENVDLVVMGTAGHSRLEEMIIGSNTEKVVRHARCPVLTVHPGYVPNEFRNIAYATNLSATDEAFAEVVVNTREMYGGKIHLLRINTPANFDSDFKVKEEMEKFARRVRLVNYTVNSFNAFSEEEGILDFANLIDADLIALSTHGRTGLAHVLAGSIAEDVANHSRRPVLTMVTTRRAAHRVVAER
jgi:nucleotide-binding universal stress UspA family protein